MLYFCGMSKKKKTRSSVIRSGKPLAKPYSKPYDWINPSRPATDEEIDELIAASENSPLLSAEEARKLSKELIAKWQKERK